MSLKNFIVREELRVNHAERYLKYLSHYNREVYVDITKALAKRWTSEVTKLSKKYQPHPEAIQDAQLKRETATVALEVVERGERISTSRSSTPIQVSPSVKIPLVYSEAEREIIRAALLKAAEETIEKATKGWSTIFHHENKSQLTPSFKIVRDQDEIRFQLIASSGSQETYNTLYTVRVEYGKVSSKIRDFDRIYFYSVI